MMHPRGVLALLASAALLAAAAGGCSIIVSGDVPDFQCSPGGASVCPSGMTCSDTGQCVSGEGGILDPVEAGDEGDAPSDEDVQDAAKEADAPSGPLDLGSKCRVDGDCKTHLCGSSTILTTTITSSTGPICTVPCCTSSECTSGFVCFNGGTGGGYCVPQALAQRTPPASGGKIGGLSCSVSTECRSGLCTGSPKTCLDTCCVESNCGGASTCRVATVSAPGPAHDLWVCAPPESGATKLPGDQCLNSIECRSEDCVGVSGPSRICRPSCSNTASCRLVPGFDQGHCLYGPSGSDYLKFCFLGTTGSDSPAGAACSDNSTCQSDYCDAEIHKCANVCGRDADCAANETCRPSATGTPFLRCVPKP
jgi:hypothetical protein